MGGFGNQRRLNTGDLEFNPLTRVYCIVVQMMTTSELVKEVANADDDKNGETLWRCYESQTRYLGGC